MVLQIFLCAKRLCRRPFCATLLPSSSSETMGSVAAGLAGPNFACRPLPSKGCCLLLWAAAGFSIVLCWFDMLWVVVGCSALFWKALNHSKYSAPPLALLCCSGVLCAAPDCFGWGSVGLLWALVKCSRQLCLLLCCIISKEARVPVFDAVL